MSSVPAFIRFQGEASSIDEATTLVDRPGDVAIVVRGKPRWLVIRCPDGCGDVVRVNLDKAIGKAWRLYRRNDAITLFPSIWRDSGCGSHFIIWDGALILSGSFSTPTSDAMDASVLSCIDLGACNATDIADRLSESVWIIAGALARLERKRVIIEWPPRSGTYVRKTH